MQSKQKSCPSVRLPNFMKHASDQKTQVDHRIRRHKLRHASVHTLICLPTLIQQTSSKSSNNASSKHSLARHHADHWLLCVLRTHRPGRAQHKPCILKYLAPRMRADVSTLKAIPLHGSTEETSIPHPQLHVKLNPRRSCSNCIFLLNMLRSFFFSFLEIHMHRW